MEPDSAYWSAYYRGVHSEGRPWLDYSNERVQAQSLALALEAAGPLHGRSCLDVGCGNGQFALMTRAHGATRVVGVELVAETVARLKSEQPTVEWIAGDAGQEAATAALGSFDVVAALEVLQYVPFATVVSRLWGSVAPGGRLLAIVPNAACPIVARPVSRFGDNFRPVTAGELERQFTTLPGLACWGYRGLSFAEDQRIAPYSVSPWTTHGEWLHPPNRFLLMAQSIGGGG